MDGIQSLQKQARGERRLCSEMMPLAHPAEAVNVTWHHARTPTAKLALSVRMSILRAERTRNSKRSKAATKSVRHMSPVSFINGVFIDTR